MNAPRGRWCSGRVACWALWITRYPVAVSECCTGVSVVGQSSSMYFFLLALVYLLHTHPNRIPNRRPVRRTWPHALILFFLWALGPRRPRLGFGVLKDTFPIRWSPWARFLPVQLIRSAWQSAWHINFPRTRCVSPMTPDHYYAVVDRMLCMR